MHSAHPNTDQTQMIITLMFVPENRTQDPNGNW